MESESKHNDWTWHNYLTWTGAVGLYGLSKFIELQRNIKDYNSIEKSRGQGTSSIFVGQGKINSGRNADEPETLVPLNLNIGHLGLEYEDEEDFKFWFKTIMVPKPKGVNTGPTGVKTEEFVVSDSKFDFPDLKPDPVLLRSMASRLKKSQEVKISVQSSDDSREIEIGLARFLKPFNVDATNGSESISFVPYVMAKRFYLLKNMPLKLDIDLGLVIGWLMKMFSGFVVSSEGVNKSLGLLEKQQKIIEPSKTVTFICNLRHLNGKYFMDTGKPVLISRLSVPDLLTSLEQRILGLKRSVWTLAGFTLIGIVITAYFKIQSTRSKTVEKTKPFVLGPECSETKRTMLEKLRAVPLKLFSLIKKRKVAEVEIVQQNENDEEIEVYCVDNSFQFEIDDFISFLQLDGSQNVSP